MGQSTNPSGFELRFQSLFKEGRALAFPCSDSGAVDLDALSDRARHNYLMARHQIGREYAAPVILLDTREVQPRRPSTS